MKKLRSTFPSPETEAGQEAAPAGRPARPRRNQVEIDIDIDNSHTKPIITFNVVLISWWSRKYRNPS